MFVYQLGFKCVDFDLAPVAILRCIYLSNHSVALCLNCCLGSISVFNATNKRPGANLLKFNVYNIELPNHASYLRQ